MAIYSGMNATDVRASGALKFRDIPVCRYSLTTEHEKHIYSSREFVRIYRDMAMVREFQTMLLSLNVKGEYNGVKYTPIRPLPAVLGEEAVAVGKAYCHVKGDITFGGKAHLGEVLAAGLCAIEKLTEHELVAIMKKYFDGEVLAPVAERANNNMTDKDIAVNFFLYGLICELLGKKNGFFRGLSGAVGAGFLPFGIYPADAKDENTLAYALGTAIHMKNHNEKGFVSANLAREAMQSGMTMETMSFAHSVAEKGIPLLLTVTTHCTEDSEAGEEALQNALRFGAAYASDMLHAERVDGTSPMAVIDAVARKKELLERGEGPCLIEFVTFPKYGIDPEAPVLSRTGKAGVLRRQTDPMILYREKLLQSGVAREADLKEMELSAGRRMASVLTMALDNELSPRMTGDEIEKLVFAPAAPTRKTPALYPEAGRPHHTCGRVAKIAKKEHFGFAGNGAPVGPEKRYDMTDAIFEPIFARLRENSDLLLLDPVVPGRCDVLAGIDEAIPADKYLRIDASPRALVGTAMGYAMRGEQAVVTLPYAGDLDAVKDLLASLGAVHLRTGGLMTCPVTIRVPVCRDRSGALLHEGLASATGVPGVKVLYPVTPSDMKGLLSSALIGQDPVIIFENERLYELGEGFVEKGVPTEDYTIPMGKADVKKKGTDITILSIGAALYQALEAANLLDEQFGISAEIIDARSAVPFDYGTVLRSVDKTGKLLVVGDGSERGAFMREIAENLMEFAFDLLDAPAVVVGARALPLSGLAMAKQVLPTAETILDAIHQKILPLSGYTPKVKFASEEKLRRAFEGL